MKAKLLKFVLVGTVFTAAMLFNLKLNNSKLNSGSISLQTLEAKADFSVECNGQFLGYCREWQSWTCTIICDGFVFPYENYYASPV